MKDLVTVIVPVYNAEKYVCRCIISIMHQTYSNLEIVIVDDGSTDNTFEICSKIQEKDSRITVVRIENHGVSFARNLGISKARGKWITFVDADDFVSETMIEKALEYQSRYNCDTCCWNGLYSKNGSITRMNSFIPKTQLYSGVEIRQLMYGLYARNKNRYFGDYFRAVWGKLFSADIIHNHNVVFTENIKIGEDALFLLDYFFYAKKVFMVDNQLYYYELLDASVTGRYKYNFEKYQLDEFLEIEKKFKKYNLDIENVAIEFWHKAEKDYIENQLKINTNLWKIAKSILNLLDCKPALKYLKKFGREDGIKSKARTIMFRCRLYIIVALIDTCIIKKKYK